MRSLLLTAAILVASPCALAQVEADIQYGQQDPLGIAFFFYTFFCYVHIKDAFKRGEAKGWRAAGLCAAFAVAAWYFYPLQIVMVLIFLWTFLAWTWRHVK